MGKKAYTMKAKVWLYPGMAGWHFISVPKKESVKIKNLYGDISGGFGSLPVKVTMGKTSWKTSIFPDKKTGTYLLPIKAEVRKKESITYGKIVKFSIELNV